MMNKPFKGIKVAYDGPEMIQYRNGGYPQAGDLVAKSVTMGYDERKIPLGKRPVYGVVLETQTEPHFKQYPLVQFNEPDLDPSPLACNPIRLHLISRGK